MIKASFCVIMELNESKYYLLLINIWYFFKNIFVLYIKLGLFKKIYIVNINDFL